MWLSLGSFVFWEVKREIGEDWRDDGEVEVGYIDVLSYCGSAIGEKRWETSGFQGSEDGDAVGAEVHCKVAGKI